MVGAAFPPGRARHALSAKMAHDLGARDEDCLAALQTPTVQLFGRRVSMYIFRRYVYMRLSRLPKVNWRETRGTRIRREATGWRGAEETVATLEFVLQSLLSIPMGSSERSSLLKRA